MRVTIITVLLLAACTQEAPPPPTAQIAPGRFAANDRDALCVVGIGEVQRAGFIAYGTDNANCSASGTIVQTPGGWALQPAGDRDCQIPLLVGKGSISLGAMASGCAYYCAPGLSFAGKAFTRIDPVTRPATDLAGDPLC